MIFKAIYYFRVRIEEKPVSFRVCLSVQRDCIPRFYDLVKSIEYASKNLRVKDYHIKFECNNTMVVHDDVSLHQILREQQDELLDLMLCRKAHSKHQDSAASDFPEQACTRKIQSHVPVVKPTVLRWQPIQRHSLLTQNTTVATETCPEGDATTDMSIRKDSGIAMDNGPVKKEPCEISDKVAMGHRKLPDPLPLHPPTLLEPRSPKVHPLDCRPTALSPRLMPPITPSVTAPRITLPAISSITGFQEEPKPKPHLPATAPRYAHPFKCKEVIDSTTGRLCGQTFRRSYDLARHQTIHLKDRPYCYCHHCGKKFTRMDALRRHERVQGHAPPTDKYPRRGIGHRPLRAPSNASS